MKIFKKTSFFTLLIISFFLTNCKKEKINKETNLADFSQGLHSSNGILIFDSDSTFNEILQSSLGKSDDELDLWESKFENFESYRSLFLKAQKELDLAESEAEYKKVVNGYSDLIDVSDEYEVINSKYSSDLFSRFYNSDGVFQIGNKLVLYDKTGVTITKNLNSSMLKELIANKSNIETEVVGKKVIYTSELDGSKKIKTNGEAQHPYTVYGNIYSEVVYDGKRRLYIDVYNDFNPSVYTGHGGVVYLKLSQQMKKFFGNWAGNETVFHINDYNWSANYAPFVPIPYAPLPSAYYTGSSSTYSTGEAYSHYIYFIPEYGWINTFNLDGHFTSRGVPSTSRTIINMGFFN